MSTRHLPYPPDFEVNHTAAHQEERRRRALQSLAIGDVLGVGKDSGQKLMDVLHSGIARSCNTLLGLPPSFAY